MYKIVYLVALFAVICTGNGPVAPFINKCKWDDSGCLKKSTQTAIPIFAAGIPQLNVDTLDPFYLKRLDANTAGLKLVLKETKVTGMKDCIAKKILFDESQSKLSVKVLCTVDLVGQYEMKGQLLVLPIEGKGNSHVILRKLLINVEAKLREVTGADGESHWNIDTWSHSYALKDKSTVELENLFNGNELLARAAQELIASSSNEVVNEVGPPIVKTIVAHMVKNVQNFFATVPTKDLIL